MVELRRYDRGMIFALVAVAFFLLFTGCDSRKMDSQNSQTREVFFEFDAARYSFRGCRNFGSAAEFKAALLAIVGTEKFTELKRERLDFLQVARVAMREIVLIDQEVAALESVRREKSAQIEELRRSRSAEINKLWSDAVAATDQRFAERARRFQVMLAARMMERGVGNLSEPVLLEPPEAAANFESESRSRGFWPQDEQWLKRQLEAWKVYEEAWRQARSRIRREVEKVWTDSMGRLLEAEESAARDEDKASQLSTRRQGLATPLSEALEAVAGINLQIAELFQDCTEEFLRMWDSAVSCCEVVESDGTVRLAPRDGVKNRCYILFEDSVGMLHLAAVDARGTVRSGEQQTLKIMPLFAFAE